MSRMEADIQQLKSELLTALQPAFAKISEMGIRYSALPGHTMELANALNDVLSDNIYHFNKEERVFGIATAQSEKGSMVAEAGRA